jgi:hypothetical protein
MARDMRLGDIEMTDAFGGIGSSFVDKLLDSHSYPLGLSFDMTNKKDHRIELEARVSRRQDKATLHDERKILEETEAGDQIVDVAIESFIEVLRKKNAGGTLNDQEKDMFDLFSRHLARTMIEVPDAPEPKKILELTPEDLDALDAAEKDITGLRRLGRAIRSAVKAVAKPFVRALTSFINRHFRVTIHRVDVRIEKRPGFKMANPLEFRNLELNVRAKVEACVNIGRWRCTDILTPWIQVRVGRALYELRADGTKILGRPSVSNVDVVITIRPFGVKIDIPIGITSHINKQLGKNPDDQLFDLGKLAITIAAVRRKFAPQSTSVAAGSNHVEGRMEGRFVPIA